MFVGARPILLIAFVISLILFRLFGENFGLHHFQPYIALFFGLAALKKFDWLFAAGIGYILSTVLVSGGFQLWMLSPILAFGLIAVWGKSFSPKSGKLSLFGGSLAGAGIFYLLTNTMSWLASPVYAKNLGGLVQALWTGTPGLPPTWMFFRNDVIATMLFTAVLIILNKMTFGKKAEKVVPASA